MAATGATVVTVPVAVIFATILAIVTSTATVAILAVKIRWGRIRIGIKIILKIRGQLKVIFGRPC